MVSARAAEVARLFCKRRLHILVWVLQTRPEKKHLAQFGLDLIKGEVRNNVQAGVLEPVLAKTKIIQVPPSWRPCSLHSDHEPQAIDTNLPAAHKRDVTGCGWYSL